MSSEITVDAVRMALGMYQLQAKVASINIANANRPGAQAMRVDFAPLETALAGIANGSADAAAVEGAHSQMQQLGPTASGLSINLDAEVGEMVMATTQFQTLTEALNRRFGLMRLAISGRV